MTLLHAVACVVKKQTVLVGICTDAFNNDGYVGTGIFHGIFNEVAEYGEQQTVVPARNIPSGRWSSTFMFFS